MPAASPVHAARTLVAALVALFAIGCGDDALAPFQVAGTYVLQSVNGVALPAPAGYSGPADESVMVIADTLRLTADGRGSRVRVDDYPGDGGDSRRVSESEFSFTTTKREVRITFDCPPNALALCAPGPHMIARLSGGGLVVTSLLGQTTVQLVFSAVQPLD